MSADIISEVRALRTDINLNLGKRMARLEKLVTALMTKRPTVKQEAKRMGVNPSTLWRRRKKAQLKALGGNYSGE